jgi:nucleotide-binding universal stress UspA family protein
MIRSMLYATDLGLYAPFVMQHALALARTFKAELYVVHAVEPLGLFAESVLQTYLGEDAFRDMQGQGVNTLLEAIERKVLDGLRDELGEEFQDLELIRTVRVIQGDPCAVILEQAEQLGVDLLIVGSQSHCVQTPALLGRTASRVLQLSRVPVYMVPGCTRNARRAQGQPT